MKWCDNKQEEKSSRNWHQKVVGKNPRHELFSEKNEERKIFGMCFSLKRWTEKKSKRKVEKKILANVTGSRGEKRNPVSHPFITPLHVVYCWKETFSSYSPEIKGLLQSLTFPIEKCVCVCVCVIRKNSTGSFLCTEYRVRGNYWQSIDRLKLDAFPSTARCAAQSPGLLATLTL